MRFKLVVSFLFTVVSWNVLAQNSFLTIKSSPYLIYQSNFKNSIEVRYSHRHQNNLGWNINMWKGNYHDGELSSDYWLLKTGIGAWKFDSLTFSLEGEQIVLKRYKYYFLNLCSAFTNQKLAIAIQGRNSLPAYNFYAQNQHNYFYIEFGKSTHFRIVNRVCVNVDWGMIINPNLERGFNDAMDGLDEYVKYIPGAGEIDRFGFFIAVGLTYKLK